MILPVMATGGSFSSVTTTMQPTGAPHPSPPATRAPHVPGVAARRHQARPSTSQTVDVRGAPSPDLATSSTSHIINHHHQHRRPRHRGAPCNTHPNQPNCRRRPRPARPSTHHRRRWRTHTPDTTGCACTLARPVTTSSPLTPRMGTSHTHVRQHQTPAASPQLVRSPFHHRRMCAHPPGARHPPLPARQWPPVPDATTARITGWVRPPYVVFAHRHRDNNARRGPRAVSRCRARGPRG